MSNESKKILVPVGFSEQSLIALEQATMFAKPLNAEVVILSVIEQNSMFKRVFSSEEKKDNYKKSVKEDLEKIAAEFNAKTGLKTSVMVAVGTVYDEVKKVVDLLDIDMVVMGTNGKPTNLKHKFVGSNAYRVVSMVEPPVVTVRGVEMRTEIKRIVLPLMLKKQSKEKVSHALRMARMFGASIYVVGLAKNKEKAVALMPNLKQVQKFIAEKGITCEAEMMIGSLKSVADPVFEYRKKVDGDFIIITEDDDDVKLGTSSTETEQIIYGANVPVMSITPKHSKYQNQFDSF